MQRTNKSAHAPVGTAFFLFVGLAIIPVSLRAAGVEISFTPRLTAANDAWQQVSEVFGASYRPSVAPELSVVNPNPIPSNAGEASDEACSRVFACSRAAEEFSESGSNTALIKPVAHSRTASKQASRHSASSSPKETIVVAADVINATFERKESAIGALGALKVARLKRAELIKSIDNLIFKPSFQPLVEVGHLPGSKDLQVLVRFRKTVAGSTAKAAERKVFSAMASARRRECERAMLTGFSSGSPDHGEF